MRFKLASAAALVAALFANGANAQAWERREADEYNAFTSVQAPGSNGTYFSFACEGEPGKEVAGFNVQVPYREGFGDLEPGSTVRGIVDVDGERTEWRLVYDSIGDGDVVGFYAAGSPDFDTPEIGSEQLVDLVYALQNGHQATVSIPLLNVTAALPLAGSMDALRGVYLGCGMRLTGTDPWGVGDGEG